MDNRFAITKERFHVYDKNVFVVAGWFCENVAGDNMLYACLDKKRIPSRMEESMLPASEARIMDGCPINRQYFLWITLPENWEKAGSLKIINKCGEEAEVIVRIPVTKMKRIRRHIFENFEGSEYFPDGFRVRGWFIKNEETSIQVYDEKHKPIDVEMEMNIRYDVIKRSYPEAKQEDTLGYIGTCTGSDHKKIYLEIRSGKRKLRKTIYLDKNKMRKLIELGELRWQKTMLYYDQFGLTDTVKKIYSKLSGKDATIYQIWFEQNKPSEKMLANQREHKFEYEPLLSVVVPLYKTPLNYLDEMIQSIKDQTYSNWEICFSDGSGENSPLEEVLKKYCAEDPRIKVTYPGTQLRISENTNEALKLVEGDYIVFMDHDDLLTPDAFYECVKAFNEHPETEFLYTDEDKIDMSGTEMFFPHFKPDYNPDLLNSNNYICHLVVVKKELQQRVGGLNGEFDGAQDYDFNLRCVENTEHIYHIPKVLYHWRAHKDSTAENPESKEYAFEAGIRAILAHYERTGVKGEVFQSIWKGFYRTRLILEEKPLISIVIPNKDHTEDLDKCIQSIETKSSYPNLEYIIVENNSTEPETFAYYEKLQKENPRANVVFWEGKGFNYPEINNYGVTFAKGDYILLLNNDTEIINKECLEELVSFCMRKDVGAVGARLYYPDDTIQHAGVIIGLGGVAGHAFLDFNGKDPGYFGRIAMIHDLSACTAACLMVKKSVYEEVGGLDPEFAVAFNDVDLCMKIRKAGYTIVYNPNAELYHYESKSRGYENSLTKTGRFGREIALFRERWEKELDAGDPYYSPNLTRSLNDFRLNIDTLAR